MTAGAYTTELSKGQGAFREIQALLEIWHPDVSIEELKKRAVREGVMGTSSATRANDLVVRVFAKRLLTDHGRPAKLLQGLLKRGVNGDLFKQLSLIYTTRQHPILGDFIRDVYWPAYVAGQTHLSRRHAEDFLHKAFESGRVSTAWSPTMVIRTARYLLGTISEFGLLEENRASTKRILPYRFLDATGLFLAWEHHSNGFGDTGILKVKDWSLFDMATTDIIRCLERLTAQRSLIAQYSGDLLSITWPYNNEEGFLDGLARTQV